MAAQRKRTESTSAPAKPRTRAATAPPAGAPRAASPLTLRDRRGAPPAQAGTAAPPPGPVRRVALPETPAPPQPLPPTEPVWLVRVVVVLFLVGFSAFLAREVANFLRSF